MRKVGYINKTAAEFFASSDGMRAYKCNFCNYYHLTSQVNREERDNEYENK